MEVRSPDRIWEGGHVLLVAIAAEFVIARKMVAPGISGVELLAGVAALAALVAIRFYFIPRTEGGGRDAS